MAVVVIVVIRAVRIAAGAVALGVVASACGGEASVELAPVIELPPGGSAADPFPLDEVELSIARAGEASDLVSATFVRGEPLALAGVPMGDDRVVHLIGRTAGGEVAYGRTCRFDLLEGESAPTLHLWFSRTVQWAAATAPASPRVGGGTWATADEGVAVALGRAGVAPGAAAVTSIEHFDARAGAWTSVATVAPRLGGVVTALGDGRGVLLAGRTPDGAPDGVVEIVDPFAIPASRRVTTLTDDRLGLEDTAAATLSSGGVLVVGGAADAGPVDSVFEIDVGGDGTVSSPLEVAHLAHPRRGHTVTRLSDDLGAPVVVIGGVDPAGAPVGPAELYRPLRRDLSPGFAPAMVHPRSRHASVRMPDGSVLVVGGLDATGTPVATMELFTIDGGFAEATQPNGDPVRLPASAGLIDATLTPLPDGRVLLSGGRPAPGAAPTATSVIIGLSSVDGSVTVAQTADLEAPLAQHAAAALCDGTVLAIGGTNTPTAERYRPGSSGNR